MKKLTSFRTPISRFLAFRSGQTSVPPMTTGTVNPEPTPCKRDTSEQWLMFSVGSITLTIYILTLSHDAVTGSASVATGNAQILLPSMPATHPLFLFVTRAIAAAPALDTALLLNLFSALCGSLAAVLLFRLTKRVFFEFIRETPSARKSHGGDAGQAGGLGADANADVMKLVYASLGGMVATLAFAFSAPFWIASTSLHTQPFNILLVLLTADLLTCYHFTGKSSACVAGLFLLGLGLVESVVFVTLAPCALVLACLTRIRFGQISKSFVLLVLASVFAGLAANLALFTLLSAWGQAFNSQLFFQILSCLARTHLAAIAQGLPTTGWIYVFLQTTAPLLIALASIRGFSSFQDETTRWKWGVANVILTAVSIACLLNLPKTAWNLACESGCLPIMPCLSIAIATGTLFVYWCLLASTVTHEASCNLDNSSYSLRLLGFGMCGLLGIMSLRALNINLPNADGRKAVFGDRLADETLRDGSARYRLARTAPNPATAPAGFERVLSINPMLTSAGDQLFRADRWLGNATDLEKPELRILADRTCYGKMSMPLARVR